MNSLFWSRLWLVVSLIAVVLVLFGHNMMILLVVGAFVMSKLCYKEHLKEMINKNK